MKHTWHTLGPRGGAKVYETAENVMVSSEIWPPAAPTPAMVTLVLPWDLAVSAGLVVEKPAPKEAKAMGTAQALSAARSFDVELPEPVPLPLDGPDVPAERPNAVIPHEEEPVPDPSGSLLPAAES